MGSAKDKDDALVFKTREAAQKAIQEYGIKNALIREWSYDGGGFIVQAKTPQCLVGTITKDKIIVPLDLTMTVTRGH